jgi:hypothetical protein
MLAVGKAQQAEIGKLIFRGERRQLDLTCAARNRDTVQAQNAQTASGRVAQSSK